MTTATLRPARLGWADLARTASVGIRTRRLRAGLSALGIAIGIASMVAVLGLSESSRSDLIAQLDRLGTNLLVVQGAQGIGRGSGQLPDTAAEMVARIGPVTATSAVMTVDESVYRTGYIAEGRTAGLGVVAVDDNLLTTLAGTLSSGRFLDQAADDYAVTVLGSVAAERLGIRDLGVRIRLGEHWFNVIGILDPLELNPDLDRSALIGTGAVESVLGREFVPSSIYVRTDPEDVEAVQGVLAATAKPSAPEEVEVAKPSDALEAREATNDAFLSLFIGLGAVALFVGGVGIANVMVISVLERRAEIGLRRALGATRWQIAAQFFGEALMISLLGGVAGVLLGAAVTGAYASTRGWSVLVPQVALLGGILAAVSIGALAGLYPALRAARLSPTEALRTT